MFIRTERNVKEFLHRYPIVSTLIIIHILLWISFAILRMNIGIQIFNLGIGSNIAVSHGEYWRLITPIFLHMDFSHMLFNSFSLVLFGPALERMLGSIKFTIIYLLTGLIGNIGTYVMDPLSNVLHLGASGAIYGLFGIYMFMTWKRKDLIDAQSAQIVTVIFVLGLVMTFLRTNINVSAHIFGFLAGFAIAPIILQRAKRFF